MVFIKVLVYLSSATCTMNLLNPKNGTKFLLGTSQIRRSVSASAMNKKDSPEKKEKYYGKKKSLSNRLI